MYCQYRAAKRQYELIQACNMLENVKVHLLGAVRDDSYFQSLQSLDLTHVSFHGFHSNDSDYFRNCLLEADLFALPSTLETPGIAALEAAAAGLPVLITSGGSTTEYFLITLHM